MYTRKYNYVCYVETDVKTSSFLWWSKHFSLNGEFTILHSSCHPPNFFIGLTIMQMGILLVMMSSIFDSELSNQKRNVFSITL